MAQTIQIGKMWYSDIRMGGKRVRRALSIYKEQADAMLADMVELRRSQKHGYVPREVSWHFFRTRYLDEFCKTNKSPQTCYRDKLAFRMTESTITITQLHQMRPEVMETLKSRWQDNGKTQSVITRAIKALKTAMRKAEDWEYIKPQNWRKVEVIEPAGRLDFYALEALEELLDNLTDPWRLAAILMSRCGLRSGEVYHLEWKDIQFSHHRILFRSKPHLGWKIKGDKKGKKKREIPIKDPALENYFKSIAKPHGFVLGKDRPENLTLFYKLMENALADTKIKTYEGETGTPHILRHTFASHLAQQGVSMKTIASLLGHSSEKMAEIYSHLSPESLERGIAQLPKIRCSAFVPVKVPSHALSILNDPSRSDGKLEKWGSVDGKSGSL